jgi:aminodeoxychorismate synthase component I
MSQTNQTAPDIAVNDERPAPFVLLEDSATGMSLRFDAPERLLTAWTPDRALAALGEMEDLRRQGFHLAGYASYELGYVLEPRLAPLLPARRRVPLLRFGAFRRLERGPGRPARAASSIQDLAAGWSFEEYRERFVRVLDYIEAGDVYQVNLTFPMHGRLAGDPLDLYAVLKKRQPVAHGGIVALGPETVISLSPELFFEVEAGRIRARPMKGTARRGETPAEDRAIAAQLAVDEKQRAENLMIVDLLRNDLGRISRIGSVTVPRLFSVETYATLHQMTSTIEADLQPGTDIPRIMHSLFPCGSVTGAPKIRAMEIIRELEEGPRGVYCGAIGHIAPDGRMRFSVAIRTITVWPDGQVVCNVGSGVVANSTVREEYEECLLKARFLSA